MMGYMTVSKNISALAGRLSPLVRARALEAKIKECRKLITRHKLELAIEILEGVCPDC